MTHQKVIPGGFNVGLAGLILGYPQAVIQLGRKVRTYLAHKMIHCIQADSSTFHQHGHMETILVRQHMYNSVNSLVHSYQQGKLKECCMISLSFLIGWLNTYTAV